MNLSWVNTTRRETPSLPYEEIKIAAVGAKPEVSLAFVGDVRAKALNVEHRGKSYVPNTLSFPFDNDGSGEIFINLNQAERQAHKYGMSYEDFVAFLFIHSLLHLDGLDHGSIMERKERQLLRRFIKSNVQNRRLRN
ncbi:MAG TPA: rRNA maturation RNase YbeY [Candidatus Paceibacterota bacterium]|nr:rRNA maturation RNase YbeY [Candidatus Paceibacterota bacterium]